MVLIAYGSREGSDKPAQMCSFPRDFTDDTNQVETYMQVQTEFQASSSTIKLCMYEGDQNVRGEALLNHIVFINCNENSQGKNSIFGMFMESWILWVSCKVSEA